MNGPDEGSLAGYDGFELIGEGASAKVYKAVEKSTGSTVVVKVLNPYLRTDAISVERFRREIEITRFLGHPQVVAFYDLVEAGGSLALVMEYVPGHNLKDHLGLHGPLEVDTCLDFLRQILEVLAVCHAKDVIHRDLKPQNVMVGPEGRLKLLDFGIARMTGLSDLTQTGTSLGSPEYMAPELFAASSFDPRTDLYAVGVMAYEMLTGELPFQGDSVAVLFRQHLEAPVPRAGAKRPGVPAWLDALIGKLLAKDPYQRYQVAEEVLADLARQQVTSQSLPEPARRECLRCARTTLAEIPVCTSCGYEQGATLAKGLYNVCFLGDTDPEKVRRFLARVFRLEPRLPRKLGRPGGPPEAARLVVADVDRMTADLVKSSGRQHGLYLEVRKRPFPLRRTLADWFLVVAVAGLLALASWVPGLWRHFTRDVQCTCLGAEKMEKEKFPWNWHAPNCPVHQRWSKPPRELKMIPGVLAIALVASIYYYTQNRKPLIGPSQSRLAVLAGLVAPPATIAAWATGKPLVVFGILAPGMLLFNAFYRGKQDPPVAVAEFTWVRELVPLLAQVRSPSLQAFISGLIEKRHLLIQGAPHLGKEFDENLRQLIRDAAQVAGVVAELEAVLDDAGFADRIREYMAIEKRIQAEDDAERREALRGQLQPLAAKLRRFYDLDAKRAALNRRLVHLQYTFNTLLGKSLVFHNVGAPEVRELEVAVQDLEREVKVSREVRQALKELV